MVRKWRWCKRCHHLSNIRLSQCDPNTHTDQLLIIQSYCCHINLTDQFVSFSDHKKVVLCFDVIHFFVDVQGSQQWKQNNILTTDTGTKLNNKLFFTDNLLRPPVPPSLLREIGIGGDPTRETARDAWWMPPIGWSLTAAFFVGWTSTHLWRAELSYWSTQEKTEDAMTSDSVGELENEHLDFVFTQKGYFESLNHNLITYLYTIFNSNSNC